MLKKGKLRINKGGQTKIFEIDKGYAEITGEKVTVLPEKVY